MAATTETEGAQHSVARPNRTPTACHDHVRGALRHIRTDSPECSRLIVVNVRAGAAGHVTHRAAPRFDFNLQSIPNSRLRT